MTKSFNRSSILRAAWASARYIADLVGEPVLRHIGAAMRNCWYIAKHGRAAFADAPSMMPQPVQQQQARARNDVNAKVRIVARGHLGFACDPDHADASLWIVTDGQISRDCATHQEALDLADESRGLGYIPAIVPRLPQQAEPAPAMVPQLCQQQQACAARPIPEQPAPAVPPHLSSESEVDHGWYINEMLAEMMDDEPAPPRPQPTVMETIVGRAFTDGLMLGRQMAISEIETLFAELIAKLRKTQ